MIPQTPTSLDKTEEVRKLNVDIATLKSQKEILDREHGERIAEATLLSGKIEGYKAEIANLERVTMEAIQTAASTVKRCIEQVREALGTATRAKELLAHLIQRTDQEIAKAKEAVQEQERAHKSIVAETAILDTNKADLDIYKSRLENHFKEHLPNQKIVL